MNKQYVCHMDYFKRKVKLWKLSHVYDVYKDSRNFFMCYSGNLEEEYHSIDESIPIMKTFLKFQFQSEELVSQFLCYLYAFLDKQTGKKNGLQVTGPPDCGKSWFFSSISALMMTVGSASIMNKTANFPFGSCDNVRLIRLDELTYDPQVYTDTFKQLLSGEPMEANKKYMDNIVINKTPVIVMSNNNEVFPNTDAFSARLTKMIWRPVKGANYFYRKIHPFAFYKIWRQLGNGDYPPYEWARDFMAKYH